MLALKLKELVLRNYRNYENLELSFDSDLVIFAGKNAQGKTNILEAIFLSCTGRSHKTSKDRELIKWGKGEAFVRTRVLRQQGIREISIGLFANEKKKVFINRNPVSRIGELMGHLNSVLFSPDDMKLIREGPSERRRFMDMELSQVQPAYFYYLQQYNRVLNQRNKLLKEIQKKPSLISTLSVWDEQLADAGSYIILQRKLLCDSLQIIAQEIHHRITQGAEKMLIIYKPSVSFNNADRKEVKKNFLRELEIRRTYDLERGITSKGCHRDDLLFQINGMDVRTYGSQGQMRTIVLSLKLSELEFMFRETGEYPLLLLDDAMSELDPIRQQMVLEYIGKAQTFITLTDMGQIPAFEKKNMQVFIIEAGKASPC